MGKANSLLVKKAVELSKPRIEVINGMPRIVRPPGTPKYSHESSEDY